MNGLRRFEAHYANIYVMKHFVIPEIKIKDEKYTSGRRRSIQLVEVLLYPHERCMRPRGISRVAKSASTSHKAMASS